MNILQDLVLLHSEKKNKKFPIGISYNSDARELSCIELIVIGVGALFLLCFTAVMSIPDKARQEELKNIDMGRDFIAHSCNIDPARAAILRVEPKPLFSRHCAD